MPTFLCHYVNKSGWFWTWRETTAYWKIKDIDSGEQRSKGYCPLTPKEVGIFLAALGYPTNTPIYIAAGEIYGGDSHMANLQSRYPILMSKVWTCILVLYVPILKKSNYTPGLGHNLQEQFLISIVGRRVLLEKQSKSVLSNFVSWTCGSFLYANDFSH